MKNESKQFFESINAGGLSLRWRFMIYVISCVVTSVMLLMLLLSLFGVLNPSDGRIEAYIDNQLDNHAAQTEHDIDKLAAYLLSFSGEMEEKIDNYLTKRGLTFDELANDIDALSALQAESYRTVYTNVRVAPCSGAFYILNTSVRMEADEPHCNGIYIKFANLYSENTINTKVSLFRGFSKVARENNINLSSTWQNEMKTNAFDDTDIFIHNDFILSSVEKIPDTWERARYIYAPIYGENNRVIGICGFELSDLYMQIAYNTADTQSAHVVCALLDEAPEGYTGQFISNRSGYLPPACDTIFSKKYGSFREYRCGKHSYIGKEKMVKIGSDALTVAIMLPKKQYKYVVYQGQMKNIAIFFIVAMAAFCICIWMSTRYITPIRKSITQFKINKNDYTPSGIAEIDDLFAYLAEQDRINETEISELKSRNEQMQNTIERVNSENSEARQEIARLAYSRKNEVDPDDYKQFLIGVKTLTQTEKTVFEYYLEGKKVKEIVELLGIKESTVRFHNRNIYSKLGVNSLKQLLLCAAIMKRDEENNE